VSRVAAETLGRPLPELNIITCHLGNGCSLAAVRGGQAIDTTMGLTPLAGAMMGTRCGDIDPAIPLYLISKGFSAADADRILNKESGLKGVCGLNDMRDIHAAAEKGDPEARLALDMFCYSLRRQIGALWACLGKVDCLVFTAGIGENDDLARAGCLQGLESWGVELDADKNRLRGSEPRVISRDEARVKVLVVPTTEELEIARATLEVLRG
jgi:acetate kinase